MWALSVRELDSHPGIESTPITPKTLDMAMDMTLSSAARLEEEFGGGRQMMAFQDANPYTMPPWANAAETESNNIRRECFPLILEPFKGDSHFYSQHLKAIDNEYEERYNPVRVSISVARSDAPEWKPGVRSLPVAHGRGGLLGTLDDVAVAVQGVIERKGSRRQASHMGAKWLIVICTESWVIWQIQEAFGKDQRLSEDELFAPVANISLTPFERVWIVCPANNTGEHAHVVQVFQGHTPNHLATYLGKR